MKIKFILSDEKHFSNRVILVTFATEFLKIGSPKKVASAKELLGRPGIIWI